MRDDRSGNPSGCTPSAPSESWLFAQELLGRPVDMPAGSAAEAIAERELRNWVEEISTDRDRPYYDFAGPARGAPADRELREWVASITTDRGGTDDEFQDPERSATAEQELREWVASISNARETWDSALHPRGGFPENPGWFSPSGGGSDSGRSDRIRRADIGDHSPTTPDHPKQADQLAQGPPPPAQQRTSFATRFPAFTGQPVVPAGQYTASTPQARAFHDRLKSHLEKNVPPEILGALTRNGVKYHFSNSIDELSDYPEVRQSRDGVTGGVYSPSRGTVFMPQTIPDVDPETGRVRGMKPNEYAENNIRHETGHPFDHMTNGSVQQDFRDAYHEDLAKLKKSVREGNPNLRQFLPERKAGGEDAAAREAFAQGFATATRPTGAQDKWNERRPAFASDFERYFPKTTANVRGRIGSFVRQNPLPRQRP